MRQSFLFARLYAPLSKQIKKFSPCHSQRIQGLNIMYESEGDILPYFFKQLDKPTYVAEVLTVWKFRILREHTVRHLETTCI